MIVRDFPHYVNPEARVVFVFPILSIGHHQANRENARPMKKQKNVLSPKVVRH